MSEELDVLRIVCLRLEEANIPYMLTGSVAANFYVNPRMTRDIDIVIEIKQSDIEKLFKLFEKDFYIDRSSITEAMEHRSMFNIIHNEFVVKLDFIVRKNSTYRILEFQRRRRIQLGSSRIWIVALEDLIISKLEWAKESMSEIQLRDIKNLMLASNLDKEYMNHWVCQLELNQIYENVKIDE